MKGVLQLALLRLVAWMGSVPQAAVTDIAVLMFAASFLVRLP